MSKAEEEFALHLKVMKVKGFEREYKFHAKRRWRFDFAHPKLKLAVEIEGITSWGKNKDGSMKIGRHQSAKGIKGDLEKYDEAMRLGWTIYRCSQDMVSSGRAIDTLRMLINVKEDK